LPVGTNRRAIRLILRDDLERSRPTVLFRFFLALPHLVWLAFWFSLVWPVAIANWIATLISGESSPTLHRFLAAYVRYVTHVVAYVSLAADRFPAFIMGRAGTYAVDLEFDPPGRQSRWATGFRLVLALPAMLLADTMLGLGTSLSGGATTFGGGVVATTAFLAWFACLVNGRMPQGLRDLTAWAIGFSAQVSGYLLILTDRYPDADPAVGPWAVADRADPIDLSVDDDLRRSRLTVFFRLPLTVPHFAWALLWTIPVFFVSLITPVIAVIKGRLPGRLHRFLAAYVRYVTHLYAFLGLVGNPFPGFTGRAGTYPIELHVDEPRRQNRWVTGLRLILMIPAFLLSSAIGGVATIGSVLAWFVALFTGRMPRSLRNLGALALRYNAQTLGYALLLTDRYPYSGPEAAWQPSLGMLQEA